MPNHRRIRRRKANRKSPAPTPHFADTQEPSVEKLDRITQRPETMSGKACIRGIRITVSMIVGQIGTGRGIDDLLAEYPYLEREDILQALRYAARRT
jgi:uncharacterized protein (DUF433 family)